MQQIKGNEVHFVDEPVLNTFFVSSSFDSILIEYEATVHVNWFKQFLKTTMTMTHVSFHSFLKCELTSIPLQLHLCNVCGITISVSIIEIWASERASVHVKRSFQQAIFWKKQFLRAINIYLDDRNV